MNALTPAVLAALIAAVSADVPSYRNPVLRGDYPDPSVVRVGNDYFATATSSEWAPHFPILHSNDLVNWTVRAAVFPEPPAWASGNFWAPELCAWKGRFYLYYTARKKDGPLSVAVASADRPDGPWTDHGPLVSQEAGSIDGAAIDDENGQRFLVWKEDGNSRQLPTILWAQPLDETGTRLTGERREILRNDVKWEGAVVEGPFLLKRDGWFHLFYAGNSCCGSRAEYAEGSARSKSLLGPWEKCPRNPLLAANEAFRAPGHGSIVDDPSGRLWLLYHAYSQPTMVFTGREMMLDEVTFGTDGWPAINSGNGPSVNAPAPLAMPGRRAESTFRDEFRSLQPGWQWPIHRRPRFVPAREDGTKAVLASTGDQPAILGRSVTSGDLRATAVFARPADGAMTGLSACGDPGNMITLECADGKAAVVRTERGKRETLSAITLPDGPVLHLRLSISGGHRLQFAVSPDGQTWTAAGDGDGGFLPPWDRSIRTALVVRGAATVHRFQSEPLTP